MVTCGTVLATIKADWERYSDKQRRLITPRSARRCRGTIPSAWSSSTRASVWPSTVPGRRAQDQHAGTSVPITPKPKPWWMKRWIVGKSSRRRVMRMHARKPTIEPTRPIRCAWLIGSWTTMPPRVSWSCSTRRSSSVAGVAGPCVVVYPHLPAAAKARMKELSVGQAQK